jgi:hypothetical protein
LERPTLLMNDTEFEILDELYFVISYTELVKIVDGDNQNLSSTLKSLYQNGWIKILSDVDNEWPIESLDFERDLPSAFFLITKKGLLAHNTSQ